MIKIYENDGMKIVRSKNYNYNFDKMTGYFERWGVKKEDDPQFSPYGPEIIDIEITDICGGIGNYGPCNFCYKANTLKGSYMKLETFKKIFHKLPATVNQIAYGVDAKCETNPDIFKIMEYTRENGVIPNITVADISDETAKKLADICGAVAVSFYGDKEICYGSIQKLRKYGMKQINIHNMICEETLEQTYDLINDKINNHEGLEGLNAIVLLALKQRGRGKNFTPLTQKDFNILVSYAMMNNISIGFDSCSAHPLMETIKNFKNKEEIEQSIEPCESSLFSFYINTFGYGFPCSFIEGIDEWENGINMLSINTFLKDVWYDKKVKDFRKNLLVNKRNCPKFKII